MAFSERPEGKDQPSPYREILVTPGITIRPFTQEQIQAGLGAMDTWIDQTIDNPGNFVKVCETLATLPNGLQIQIDLLYYSSADLENHNYVAPYGDERTTTRIGHHKDGYSVIKEAALILNFWPHRDSDEQSQTLYEVTLPDIEDPISGYLSQMEGGDIVRIDFAESPEDLGTKNTTELLLPGEPQLLSQMEVIFTTPNQEPILN